MQIRPILRKQHITLIVRDETPKGKMREVENYIYVILKKRESFLNHEIGITYRPYVS